MIKEAVEPLEPSNSVPYLDEKGFALDREIFSGLRRVLFRESPNDAVPLT